MSVTKSLEQLYSVPLPHYISFRKIVLAVPNYPACPELPRLTVSQSKVYDEFYIAEVSILI